jgi:hypothetical protein
VIRGRGGLRKPRWAGEEAGKRGGLRVLYLWDETTETFYMLYVYRKNKQEDVSTHQPRVLTGLVREEFG